MGIKETFNNIARLLMEGVRRVVRPRRKDDLIQVSPATGSLMSHLQKAFCQATEHLENMDNKSQKLFGFISNVDVTKLDEEDRAFIRSYIERLHDLALQHDVKLEIAGLDRKEDEGAVFTARKIFSAPAVVVEIDPYYTYDRFSHPNPEKLINQGIELIRSRRKENFPGQSSAGTYNDGPVF